MADQKITALTALTTPATDDLLAIVDDVAGTPTTKKVTLANLLTLFLSNVTVQVKTDSSGTYTPTATAKKVLVILVGGGGAGGDITAADETSGGGGGGGCVIQLRTPASEGYTVGQSATGTGNATTLGSGGTLLTAGGGGAGGVSGNSLTLGISSAGGTGGTATGGDLNIPGQPGERGTVFDTTNGYGGAGGRSAFGFGGARTASETAGSAGAAYGGGGSGAHTGTDVNRNGGDGAAGVIYFIEFLG